MTTTIDSLVLEFGLDHRQFTKGQREVLDDMRKFEDEAQKSGTRAEAGGKKVADVMGAFRREAVAAIGVLLGGRGIVEFTNYVTNLDAQTSRLARTMNMSTRELSAWQGVSEQIGGSKESITGTLKGMTQDMNTFMLTGQGVLSSVLRPFGIGISDNNGKLKTATELMLELADATAKMDPARANAYLSMIPGMNQDSINLIMEGRRAIEQMLQAQRQLGGTTEWSAEQAKQYQKEIANLDRAATNFGRNMLLVVAPSVTKAMQDITRAMREGLNPHIGKGSFLDVVANGKDYDLTTVDGLKGRVGDLWGSLKGYDPRRDEGLSQLANAMNSQNAQRALDSVKNGPVGGGNNWDRFLKGLSYLETSGQNVGNATSSAKGYFQFINGTAAVATKAGLPDPRVGDYNQQAAATRAFIQRFHPDAAAAIESGDVGKASTILNGTWPSLPGGSQPQNANRYTQWSNIVNGGSSSSRSNTTTVGTVVVHTQATDAKGIADDIKPALERGSFANQFNGGLE